VIRSSAASTSGARVRAAAFAGSPCGALSQHVRDRRGGSRHHVFCRFMAWVHADVLCADCAACGTPSRMPMWWVRTRSGLAARVESRAGRRARRCRRVMPRRYRGCVTPWFRIRPRSGDNPSNESRGCRARHARQPRRRRRRGHDRARAAGRARGRVRDARTTTRRVDIAQPRMKLARESAGFAVRGGRSAIQRQIAAEPCCRVPL
jgi:hypothetical protein